MRVSLVWHLPHLGTSFSFMFHFWLFFSLFHCSIHPRQYHHIIFPLPTVVNILWRHCEWEPLASIHYPECWHVGPLILILQLASILSAAAALAETEEEICGDIRSLIIISSASVWWYRKVARELSPLLSINMCSICSLYLLSDTVLHCQVCRHPVQEAEVCLRTTQVLIYKLPNQKFWSRLYSLWVFFCR